MAAKISSNLNYSFTNPIFNTKTTITLQKIKYVFEQVLKIIFATLTFPVRYLGSKTWSIPGILFRLPLILFHRALGKPSPYTLKQELFWTGYQTQFEKTLSRDETRALLPYACSTAVAHTNDPEWVKPFGYHLISPRDLNLKSACMEAREQCFYDSETGLKATLSENDDTVIITFGSRNNKEQELKANPTLRMRVRIQKIIAIIQNYLGAVPKIYREADAFLQQLLQTSKFSGKKVILVGSSWSGSLVSFLALKNRIQAYCFNPLQLGVGLQQEIGKNALRDAERYISILSVKNDYVSDLKIYLLDYIFGLVGLKTPGNFGRRCVIPSAYKNLTDTHGYFIGSMMNHLGYDKRDVPHRISWVERVAQEVY